MPRIGAAVSMTLPRTGPRRRVVALGALLAVLLIASTSRWVVPYLAGSGVVVVLDAGHGGDEAGASDNGIIERDSNLDFAMRVKQRLEREGIRVVLTRTGSARPSGPRDTSKLEGYSATFVDLQNRVRLSNRARGTLFVSLHSNSFDDRDVRGADIYYDPLRTFADRSLALAQDVQAGLRAALQAAGLDAPVHDPGKDTDLVDAAGTHTPLLA